MRLTEPKQEHITIEGPASEKRWVRRVECKRDEAAGELHRVVRLGRVELPPHHRPCAQHRLRQVPVVAVERTVGGGHDRTRGIPRDGRARLEDGLGSVGRECAAVLKRVQADYLVVLVLPAYVVLVKDIGGQVALKRLLEVGRAGQQKGGELCRLDEAVASVGGGALTAGLLCLHPALLDPRSLCPLSIRCDGVSRTFDARHRCIRLPARCDVKICDTRGVAKVCGKQLLVDPHLKSSGVGRIRRTVALAATGLWRCGAPVGRCSILGAFLSSEPSDRRHRHAAPPLPRCCPDERSSRVALVMELLTMPPRKRRGAAMLLPLALFIIACVPIAAIFARRGAAAQNSVMHSRVFGTCIAEVQDTLRWGVARSTANRICCHNRQYAEWSGYWATTEFLAAAHSSSEITFYDSVTGKRLFVAPKGRTMEQVLAESHAHGWPSFRDAEVVRDNVVLLDGGEAV